ncbi:MAG: methyltransferase domain-containing protein [Chloroflexaceae bacterium]|nr:methyltransferase domain-containing protein [Chloroflexaceae bacterium]
MTTSQQSIEQRKDQLRNYFAGVGFARWHAIYGQGKLTGVRRSIREGHTMVLNQVQTWIQHHDLPPDAHILDAGCGTGLLSVALARQGFRVTAVDIAFPMVREATYQLNKPALLTAFIGSLAISRRLAVAMMQ